MSKMFSVKDNLIEEVVTIIAFVNTQAASDTTNLKDFKNDIHFRLCHLLSAMLSSPLTGRVYLSTPETYIDTDEKTEAIAQTFSNHRTMM